jgi:hypothetical protein
MNRREFIAGLGGAAAWPLAVRGPSCGTGSSPAVAATSWFT